MNISVPPLPGSTLMITGIMAAGKSTIAQSVAERLPASVHLRGDVFRRMVVNGRHEMTQDADDAAFMQLRLRYRLAASAATLYAQAGFAVVYQDVILGPMLGEVVAMLPRPLYTIVLCPSPEAVFKRDQARHKVAYQGWTPEALDAELRTNTPRLGFWLDTTHLSIDETVTAILENLPRARISP